SAGGHLAATAGTHFDSGNASATDPIDRAVSRPDFLILCYPVISFLNYVHQGSKRSLLGENPDPRLVENLSNEKHVTAQPPHTLPAHFYFTPTPTGGCRGRTACSSTGRCARQAPPPRSTSTNAARTA